ncbi:MAG: N-acetylmuramoyl-L-alanine amidase [Anaerotignaceae bacterium]
MKINFKKLIIALTTAFCVVGGSGNIYGKTVDMNLVYDGANHAYSAEEVSINVNGEKITGMDVPPVIINSRTLVPARAIFEKMGAEVTWNADSKEVYIVKNTDLVVLKINSDTGHTNGLDFKMDTPAKILNDRTMIPVRAASEALGCTVGWEDATRLISINEAGYTAPVAETPSAPSVPSTPSTDTSTGTTPIGNTIQLTGVSVPSSTSEQQIFTVKASGVIEKYDCFLVEENRIVVDVYNADMGIANTNITTTNSAIVKSIRSAQNQTEPVKIARVVLDLSANVKYSASLSNDKKSIAITFDTNTVTDLSIKTDGNTDVITVYGSTTPAVDVFALTNPDRIVIDIPNSTSQLLESYTANLNYIDTVRTGIFENTTTRIVLETNKYVNYQVVTGSGSTTVNITKSTLDNLVYDASTKTIVLKNVDGLNESDFNVTDNYLLGNYKVTLKGNYQSTYGYGIISANDEFVSGIVVQNTTDGNTQFVINENSIIATNIFVDENEIRIKIVSPKDVYSKIVVIDAGHGKTDPGASGNGLVEKDVNLDIMLRVYDLLEANNSIKVYATRLDDSYPTNVNRAKMANGVADLFVSIHQNSNTSAVPNGTEVLYTVHATDVSGKLTSQIAAQFIQNYLVQAMGTTDRGIKNRSDLIVLNQTTVPAVLIETAFLSNQADADKLSQDSYKDDAAQAIYSAIVDMMNQYNVR